MKIKGTSILISVREFSQILKFYLEDEKDDEAREVEGKNLAGGAGEDVHGGLDEGRVRSGGWAEGDGGEQ